MITLFLLLFVCAAGALLARRIDVRSERLTETLALGSAIGLALFASIGFVFGWAFGLKAWTVVAAAFLTAAVGAVFGVEPAVLLKPRKVKTSRGVLILTLLAAGLVVRLADRTLIETPDGIATGDRHNYGDLPFHMSIAATLAYGNNFPPAHPELAGVPLTYPFFCDLISGMALAVGGSWRDAFLWATAILGLSVVVALVRFGEAVTRSRALGRVTAALTLFSGGLGFMALFEPGGLARWWGTGTDLTITETTLRYANFVMTLFIPQRSILFGWPLLFFGLALVVESLRKEDSSAQSGGEQRTAFVRAGFLASFLPLVHSHSFVVMGFCVLVFAAASGAPKTGRDNMIAFLKGALPLATPAVLFMLTHNSLATERFFKWEPWFHHGAADPLKYWLMNAGLFLPLAGLGVARAPASAVPRFLAYPFVALFVLANMFRLSPWIWDNMKFLAPAHAGLAAFAALALAQAWNRGRWLKGLAALGFVVAILSGALDVFKIVMAKDQLSIFDAPSLEFAERVRNATEPGATILTAPTHNHPVLLSGRRVFLGYEGHLWSQGLDYMGRKSVANAWFSGTAPSRDALRFIPIDAVALTPAEQGVFWDSRSVQGLPSLVEAPYRLLRVR